MNDKPTEQERRLMAAEQKAARLRAELERAERELATLRDGKELPKPKTERVSFMFAEPVLALTLTLTPSQLDMFSSILRINNVHGTMRRLDKAVRRCVTGDIPKLGQLEP